MFLNLMPKQQLRRLVCFYQHSPPLTPLHIVHTLGANGGIVALSHIGQIGSHTRKLALQKTGDQMNCQSQRCYITTEANRNTSPNADDCTKPEDAKQSQVNSAIDDDMEEEVADFSLKTLLYHAEADSVMQDLNNSNDAKELLETVHRHSAELERQHYIQCVILLWNNHLCDGKGDVNDKTEDTLLQYILKYLETHVPAMNIMEKSCCYLYLRKMGVSNTHIVLQELLMESLHEIATTKALIPLPALSRLAVGINTERDFHIPTVCDKFIPHIVTHIEFCDNEKDARLLSICLLNLHSLITTDILDTFRNKLQQLLERGLISSHTSPRVIVKLMHLLNLSNWSLYNSKLIRDLLLQLKPNIAQLSKNDLKTVCRIFQYHLEPAALSEPLARVTQQSLEQNPTPDMLAAYMPFAEPHRREPLVALFKRLLFCADSWQKSNHSGNFFSIIRALKISDAKVCDAYWANVLNLLATSPEEETQLRFIRHCHRYMNFNNNLGGTYRFIPLERKLSEMAMRAIEGDIAGRIPTKFSRLASFVMAYGHTPFSWKKFPNMILSKIISMSSQFSIMDCFLISRGMQISLELRFRHNIPSLIGMQLATIDSILIDCAARYLESNEALAVTDLNNIVRILGNRKSLQNKVIYQEALNRYKDIDYSELNSRIVREMAFNFNMSGFIAPKALDAMFKYIESNHEHVIGDTVEKVLTCAYNLGYTPHSQDVLEFAAQILKRDFEHMSGLSIVQACLALCYYKTIPGDLIDMVFCAKFIQRVEEEIQSCYSKATYPERVLNLVMQLNRTVCLDFPEANIPWFQQNYLEAQLSKKHTVQNRFSGDVKKLLEAVLKDETYFRCNHTTPYGYQIDFVIHFDQNRKPIAAPLETTMLDRITKVAILLLRLDSFCENDLTALRGPEYLKMKHLEMLGYKVLHINEHDWNSKYMNVPGAKVNYLKCLLQITN